MKIHLYKVLTLCSLCHSNVSCLQVLLQQLKIKQTQLVWPGCDRRAMRRPFSATLTSLTAPPGGHPLFGAGLYAHEIHVPSNQQASDLQTGMSRRVRCVEQAAQEVVELREA